MMQITPEECARRIIQRELGRGVALHDDGSRPSMYDLRVGASKSPDIAIECVGAVDQQRTETWNVGPARGSFPVSQGGTWHVVLRPDAVVKDVRSALPDLLDALDRDGFLGYRPTDAFLRVAHPSLYERLDGLRIDAVARYSPGEPGRVFLGMSGFGGAVDPTGREVPPWIGDFLRARPRQDVLKKLAASEARECHVFVIVTFGGVPWLVESYLGTHTNLLPTEPPDLPAPVSSVWIMYGEKGVRWAEGAWQFFNAQVPPN